jgi:hypothetical protein
MFVRNYHFETTNDTFHQCTMFETANGQAQGQFSSPASPGTCPGSGKKNWYFRGYFWAKLRFLGDNF